MLTSGNVIAVGDYGNPTGTGAGRMSFNDLPFGATEVATAQTAVQTFHAAVKTAQLTATVGGDVSINVKSENFPAKPDADVNVDRVLVYSWRTKSDSSIHRGQIPGVPATSTGIDKLPEGERLNDTGKAALVAALNALYGIVDPDTVIIMSGKVLQKA